VFCFKILLRAKHNYTKREIEMKKIYLDDERPKPDGWLLVATPDEMIEHLKEGDVEWISLDHDLGEISRTCYEKPITGMDVLKWIEEQVVTTDYVPPRMMAHTANPVAKQQMHAAMRAIYKMVQNRE
jgi:hypothetical protein